MPIQILPPRLANQIAAGEVVERPASVVKELIENSLDAGATQIEIDIEKGGAKCIRVTDNGNGVDKEQLTLALSRHATSKISNLDDLEAIVSLGFRGEALASVSSVSRLTFTSKTAEQEQAWQAIAEGRDMQVNVQPAAHPQGTTVEVLDLFFNTPARRRFLKTEKTEFQHIEALIRRVALSCFDIGFVLKHNGKMIHQYRAAKTQAQKEKRLASICSDSFVRGALHFQRDDKDLKISGWVTDSGSLRGTTDVQYCYINGRMIRDKLVNHAIKQVFAFQQLDGKFPGYVIYIECNPEEVDVNVHPSKHEVRFHQARWVHDFIVTALSEVLNQSILENQDALTAPTQTTSHDYQLHDNSQLEKSYHQSEDAPRKPLSGGGNYQGGYSKPSIDAKQVNAYCDFVSEAQVPVSLPENIKYQQHGVLGQIVAFINHTHLLFQLNHDQNIINTTTSLVVVSLNNADMVLKKNELFSAWENGEVIAQPLLLPVRIQLEPALLTVSEHFNRLLARLGFSVKNQANKLIISKVPALLRQAPLAKIFPILLEYLSRHDTEMDESQVNDFCCFLVDTFKQNQLDNKSWSVQSANELIDLLINLFPEQLKESQGTVFFEPDLTLLLQGISNE